MNETDPDPLAAQILTEVLADIRGGRPFRRFAGLIDRDLELAYRLQADVTAALADDQPGRLIGGYKIAFNGRLARDYYKLAEPCCAPIFSDQILPSGACLPLSAYRNLIVEAEIALVMGADLPAHAYIGIDEVADAVSHCAVAIELLDPRGAFPHDPSAAEAVAQRIYTVGAVLGDEKLPLRDLDWESIDCALAIDGVEIARARAAAPQPPLEAVHWLARRLGRDGRSLTAGDIVMTGAHLGTHAIDRPGQVEVTMSGLGNVRLQVT